MRANELDVTSLNEFLRSFGCYVDTAPWMSNSSFIIKKFGFGSNGIFFDGTDEFYVTIFGGKTVYAHKDNTQFPWNVANRVEIGVHDDCNKVMKVVQDVCLAEIKLHSM